MQRGRLITLFSVLGLLAFPTVAGLGCVTAPRDAGVEAVHAQVISRVEARDAGGLYDLSVPELAERFQQVFKRWVAARDGLAGGQGSDRATLREGLALRHLEGVRSAREFFIALVDFQGVVLEDGVHAGLVPESVRVTGVSATLRTRSGETFGYRQVEGTWRSELALDALQMWPDIVRLEANLARAESYLAEAP